MGVVANLVVRIGANVSDFDKQVQSLEKSLDRTGARFQTVGARLTTGLTLPILAAGTALVAVGAQFEKADAKIRVATGATGKTLEGLGVSFRTVLAEVPNSMDDTATAIGELHTRTGLTGTSLEGLATQMLNLSRITGNEISPLIRETTRLFGDWSIATGMQSESLDFLFKVSQATGITVTDLSAKLVQFGAPLRSLGFEFQEAAALMGLWEKEGVNLETVLAGMRMGLKTFAGAGVEGAEALKVVQTAILGAGTEAEAMSIAFKVFGARAGPDMARAILEGRFNIDQLTASLRGSSETINQAAKDALTAGDRFRQMGNQVMVALEPIATVVTQAFVGLIPAIQPAIGLLAQLVQWFTKLPMPVQTTVMGFFALAAALGPIVWTFGTLTRAGSGLVTMFAMLGGPAAVGALAPAFNTARVAAVGFGTSMLAIPYLGIAAGVTAIAAAFTVLIPKVVEGIQKFGMWESMKAGFSGSAAALPFIGPLLAGGGGGGAGRRSAGSDINLGLEGSVHDPARKALLSMQDAMTGGGDGGIDLSKLMKDQGAQKARAEAEAWRKEMDRITGREAVNAAEAWMKKVESVGGMTRLTASAQQDLNRALDAGIEGYSLMGRVAPAALMRTWAAMQIPGVVSGLKTLPGEVLGIPQVPAIPIPRGPDVISGLTELPGTQLPIPEIPKGDTSIFANLFGGAKDFGAQLSDVMMRALTGGGNLSKSMGGFLGSTLFGDKGLSGMLSDLFGDKGIGGFLKGVLGTILPGIGTLLGSVLGGLVDKLFGPTEYEKRVRREAAERAEISADAQKNMADLQMQAAMTGRTDLLDQFLAVQNSAAPEYLRQLLTDLNEQSENLNAAMQRYGITWEELGPKAKQAQIDMQAKQFIEDFQLLTLAGADVDLVIQKMSGSVSEFVQAAIRTGTEVPIAMQPMLTKMYEMGLLVDETGEQIELSSLNWSQTMTQGFLSVVEAINHLTRALGYDLPEAAWAGANGVNSAMGSVKAGVISVGTFMPGPPDYNRYMGDGGGGTAIIEVDGRTLAEVSVPYIPGEVQRYGLA